jgi:(1->4)-alpha-D-glucan 1-alpha-D-glucosylmutase
MRDDAVSVPRATYRVQFSGDFGFADAHAIVPYLAALGISHIYASPLLMARSGSAHGYDIVDHNRLNPEYGSEQEFAALVDELHRHGMGLVLDIVPNHMGIGTDNPWWIDVLEWGRDSPYASYFDIDWHSPDRTLFRKLLLPVLGDQYGVVLENAELVLALEHTGGFSVRYFDKSFPISPREYPQLLERAAALADHQALRTLSQDFRSILKHSRSKGRRAARREHVAALKQALAHLSVSDAKAASALQEILSEINGTAGDAGSFNVLHRLLERQAYRLAFWRVAAQEINYRRFFDINDLAGLRMERPELFEISHRLVGRLLADNKIQGLRIDHIDGLSAPREYLERLQRLADPAWRPHPHGARKIEQPLCVWVEKILASHEALREDWPVSGTTGYEFMATLNGLFVDPEGERSLTRFYGSFSGRNAAFEEIAEECKRDVMREMLAAELNTLANLFYRLAKQSRRTRDHTLPGFRDALEDVTAHFPVYRSYVSLQGPNAQDRRDIDWAVGRARKRAYTPNKTIYDFIHDVLTLDLLEKNPGVYRRHSAVEAALRFQQYSGPVMAKAIEDTAFYRYVRLASLNEVGGHPVRFATSPSAFHDANIARQRMQPFGMLATATHDHKRGEDVRARLNVISEIPREWSARVRRWAKLNARKKQIVDGREAPSPNDEYLFYQTVVGAWPYELTPSGFEDIDAFCQRIQAYMIKAVREAKTHSSWVAPDDDYEGALMQFVSRTLSLGSGKPFLEDIQAFVERIAPAGAINGLAQVLLKLTSPGVPDTYQGTELWDLSLVDPDNRRTVDYGRRRDALDAQNGSIEGALETWRDGRVKELLVRKALAARSAMPDLFTKGSYKPLETVGMHSEKIVGYARMLDDRAAIIAVPRCVAGIVSEDALQIQEWQDTALVLDGDLAGYDRLCDWLSGKKLAPSPSGKLPIAELFIAFPCALLM